MKNTDSWMPTKYVFRRSRLCHSKNVREVGIYSRLFVDLVGHFYQQAVEKYAFGDLVDLGCGKAPLYEHYRKHVNTVTCVDWPASPHGNTFIDYECDLNGKLPLDSAAFDTIVLSDVLEHIRDPNYLWDEMNRILRPNGVILMNTPFFYWLHEEPYDYYRYTPHMLREFATSRDFDVVSIEPLGGAIETLIDLKSKLVYYGIPLLGRPIAAALQWSGAVVSNSYFGRAIRARTNTKFALGYAMIVRKPR